MSFFASYTSRSRHGVYYMRFPLPLGLTPNGKRDYIRLSLGTYSPKQARAYTGYLRFIAEEYVKQIERLPMRYMDKKEAIREFFITKLEERKNAMDDDGPLTEKQIHALQTGVSTLVDMQKVGSIGNFTLDETKMLDFFTNQGMPLPASGGQRVSLVNDYNLATKWLYEKLLEHHTRLTSFERPQTPYRRPETVPALFVGDTSLPLCEVMDHYFAEHRNIWKAKTKGSYTTYKDFILQHMGPRTPIASCNAALARKVKEALQDKRRSSKTMNEYLAFGYTFFKWARANGYTDTQLFEGVAFKRSMHEQTKKEFSIEELRRIQAELLLLKSKLAPCRFWCPLIAIYTGARLNELTQLHSNDIHQLDGHWVIRITDEGEGQNVKTAASKRIVPMHPELVKLGLPDFAAKANGEELFSDLLHALEGRKGRKVSRWFNEKLLVDLNIKNKKLDFHSFRRSFTTQLLQADAEEQKVKAIIGHKQEGVTQLYNTGGYTQRQLRETIEKFTLQADL